MGGGGGGRGYINLNRGGRGVFTLVGRNFLSTYYIFFLLNFYLDYKDLILFNLSLYLRVYRSVESRLRNEVIRSYLRLASYSSTFVLRKVC